MIALVPGIIAAFVGWGIGSALGFWKSFVLAAIAAFVLLNVPWGVWIAEFPLGVFAGGFASLLTMRGRSA